MKLKRTQADKGGPGRTREDHGELERIEVDRRQHKIQEYVMLK